MRPTTRTAAAALIAAALVLAGCGSEGGSDAASDTEETTTTAAATEELEITDVWARTSPMNAEAGAVYMEITSPIDDALVGASVPTDIAGTTQIHETVMAEEMGGEEEVGEPSTTVEMGGEETTDTTEAMGDEETTETTAAMGDDTMTMQEVERIELPAGETVALEPGGYHIMLLELAAPLEVGETFELTLEFEEAGERTVTVEVREG